MSPWVYWPWQKGGFVLMIICSVGLISTYDPKAESAIKTLWFWLLLMLVALAIHETRPYKRRNYG